MNQHPEITIIIAARNEERHIEKCLLSIYDAEPFATTFEILVVDGTSTDGTKQIVTAFAAAHPEVRLLDNPDRIAPKAFNIGVRASRGDLIFILGAHSSYDRSYFRLCVETAARTGAANVGGRPVWGTAGDHFEARICRALGLSRFAMGQSDYRREDVKEGPATTAVFGCFPRETFEKYGLYDERLVLNQDWELNQRIIRGGGTIWLNPNIVVNYFGREKIRENVSRSLDIGKWNARMWKIAPFTLTPRHAIPAVFAAALIVPGVNLAALAAHQIVAAYFAAVEGLRFKDLRVALVLPPVFLAVHAAYGFGTLTGLWENATGCCRNKSDAGEENDYKIEYLAPRTNT
jgi:glycosyltransferase involved in cell wall biosynthesis